MNSKTVKLKVIDRTRTPDDVKRLSTKKIGSVWAKNGDIYRGLTLKEEEFYLPSLLGVSPTDPGFRGATRKFWTDFTVVIDADQLDDKKFGGIELEIGGSIDANGMFVPINLMDWLKYRFITGGHPRVAATPQELSERENTKYGFYIEDKQTEFTKKVEDMNMKEDAERAFLKLFAGSDKPEFSSEIIDHVIDNYRILKDTNDIDVATTLDGKKFFLFERKNANPKRFLDIVKDNLLKEKALIANLIASGTLQRVGNTIADNEQAIGNSIEEAALYLANEKNSKHKFSLIERSKALK